MHLDSPLLFEPVYMERVWGGRRLETVFGRSLPPGAIIGESWELVDRPEAQSVVHNGPLRGKTLHELWSDHRTELFGTLLPDSARFPLLIKILDCQEVLSLQVHPPAFIAKALGGEPKTEMWYVVGAEAAAELFVGLKTGVKPDDFKQALDQGSASDCVHRLEVGKDDFMFIPSGRLHAIGRGNLIFEIQQNSDTTYRVFDWNRTGLDGKLRTLHLEESLRSILWDDFEPSLGVANGETLVACDLFEVDRLAVETPRPALAQERKFAVFAVLEGRVRCGKTDFGVGQFFLVPTLLQQTELEPVDGPARVLRVSLPPPNATDS